MRAADKGAFGRRIVDWRHHLDQEWAKLRFGDIKVKTEGDQHAFEVQMYLDDINLDAVRVELFADGVADGAPVLQEMKRVRQMVGAAGGYIYTAVVSAARPATDFTPRIVPHYDGVAIPLENARVLWQR